MDSGEAIVVDDDDMVVQVEEQTPSSSGHAGATAGASVAEAATPVAMSVPSTAPEADQADSSSAAPADASAKKPRRHNTLTLTNCGHTVERTTFERSVRRALSRGQDKLSQLSCQECGAVVSWKDVQPIADAPTYFDMAMSLATQVISEGTPKGKAKRGADAILRRTSAQLDRLGLLYLEEKSSKIAGKAKKQKKNSGKASTAWSQGTGYGGASSEKVSKKDMTNAAKRQSTFDTKMAGCLRDLLPLLRQHTFSGLDTTVPSKRIGCLGSMALQYLVHNSSLTSVLAMLLRNDSLMDISERTELYSTALDVVEAMAKDEMLVGCLNPTCPFKHQLSLAFKKQNPPASKGKRKAEPEQLSSRFDPDTETDFVSLLGAIAGQKKLLKRQAGSDTDSSATKELVTLADRFDRLKRLLSTQLKSLPFQLREFETVVCVDDDDAGGDAAAAGDDVDTRYKTALQSQVFRIVKMDYTTHAFHNDIHATMSSKPLPARMKRISRELSTFATSLPLHLHGSIFVRADESRPDVLKALIVGPEDTPYQDGLFLFDIFLPHQYPQAPPKVLFRTTDGGSVRFNPNLYNEGKVCLSLLGTWSGPSWDPKHSTLLQVLMSIQSMILVENPYYNEPGFEKRASQQACATYNSGLAYQTARVAMLKTLQHPPSEFLAVVRAHFEIKSQAIKELLDKWDVANDALQKHVTPRPAHNTSFSFPFMHYMDSSRQHGIALQPAAKFKSVVGDLKAQLDKLKVVEEEIVLD